MAPIWILAWLFALIFSKFNGLDAAGTKLTAQWIPIQEMCDKCKAENLKCKEICDDAQFKQDFSKHKKCLEKHSQDLTNSCGPIKECDKLTEPDKICNCLDDVKTCGYSEAENLCSTAAAKFMTRSFKIILISANCNVTDDLYKSDAFVRNRL